jgi:hypothetical protein
MECHNLVTPVEVNPYCGEYHKGHLYLCTRCQRAQRDKIEEQSAIIEFLQEKIHNHEDLIRCLQEDM